MVTLVFLPNCLPGGRLTHEFVGSAIRHNDTAEVDYIPSDINLANSETLMQTALSRETILRRILSEDNIGGYDFVIIDCRPSLGTLLINALTAANKLLIPVQTQKFSLDGLQALNALYEQIKTAINPNITILGVLPTMVDRTSRDYQATVMSGQIDKSGAIGNLLRIQAQRAVYDTMIYLWKSADE